MPWIDILSVFMTPWAQPTACHCAISCGALDDLGEESCVLILAIHQMGKVVRNDIVGEDLELLVLFTVIEDLEGAERT
jgi:hypothetical protein